MINFDRSSVREYGIRNGFPVVDLIMRLIKAGTEKGRCSSTLFAVCPNSETVLKAGLIAAERANAPIKFAATLNQVDLDGGYTTWTQEGFVKLVGEKAREVGFEGPIIIGLDHGGPWLKDLHSRDKWTLLETTEALKVSLSASLFAGYDLLHIDPTVDKTLAPGQSIDIDTVISRTVELITYVEGIRRRNRLPCISYEVGTEEVHGGLANLNSFKRFLEGLRDGLANAGFSDVWPVFVVGKVGTDLDTTLFDPGMAQELVKTAGEYGSFIKGHYTDYVSNPEEYPASGMGAANIGPEFTEEEYKGLMELVDIEKGLIQADKITEKSEFKEILSNAVVGSGRWSKWLKPDETGRSFFSLSNERQEWLVRTGCRYIWTDPGVLAARRKLYDNLNRNGIDAEKFVVEKVVSAMMKYYKAFGLFELNDFLNSEIGRLVGKSA